MTKRKLNRDFFARAPEEVAKDLLGKVIFTDFNNGSRLETTLWMVGAYHSAEKTTDKRIIEAPGTINISYKRGYLVDICTEEPNIPSCVTLFGHLIDDQKIKGSVKTSRYLGINKSTRGLIGGAMIDWSRQIGIYEKSALTDFNIGVEYPTDKGANCQGIYFIDSPIKL